MPSAITNTTYSFNTVPLLEEVAHITNVNDNKNLTGKYAIYRPYPTYLDRSTLYMKHGDTINVPITNPSGGAIAFVSGNTSNGTARQQYPVPTTTSTTSGGTFRLTWPSPLAANNPQTSGNNTSFTNDAQWPFFGFPYSSSAIHSGSNVVSGSGGIAGVLRPGYKYSRKIRLSIVTGVLGFDTGETKTITQGHSSINIFSGSSITGLNKVIHNNTNSPSGTTSFANKLYLSVWNSAGTAKFTNSTVSGKWGVGTAWLGFISDSNPTVSLNTASLVPGVYRIYLNHYSGATASPTPGDRRVSTDGRLYYITLTVNSSTTGPNAFSFNPSSDWPASTAASQTSQLSGMAGTNTVSQLTSGFTATANGTAISVNSTVPNNALIQLNTTSNSTAGSTKTGTITIGGVTGSWSIITTTSTTIPTITEAGSANYGLEIINDSGNIIFGPSARGLSVILFDEATIGAGAFATVACEGMLPNNSTDITLSVQNANQPGGNVPQVKVERLTNQFKLTNTTNTSKTFRYIATRV